MKGDLGVLRFALFVVSACASSGCSGSTEEEPECASERQAAKEFLDANRACQGDEDCAAVSTGCYDYPAGYCKQAIIHRDAATSSTWQELGRALVDCSVEGESCERCLAVRPACTDGICTNDLL